MKTTVSNQDKIPPLLLEQVALGEREDPRADPAVVAALRRENAAFLADNDVAARVAEIERRSREAVLAKEKRSPLMWLSALGAPALAAAAILFFVVAPPADDDIRTKGARPHLVVETPAGQLQNGAAVASGDRLMISYVASGARFGAVFSVDGTGAVTRHFPVSGTHASALSDDGKVSLPRAFVLDDAPDFERFYLVTADRAFALADVEAELKLGHTPGLAHQLFEVKKR